ncbi:DNA binding domain-containing protein, excisionase family [Selenomonas sp. GACV-9]|nr:DNA binding domain-containing protein, excisionase family [Selenomonas ruminantium]SFT67223.1 DNA binding domain-containing protein, excisionase family [Selenomonas ruminantium]
MDEMAETSKILLSVQEFSKITGLGEKSIRRLSHVRGFPAIRIGHRIMIHKQSAEDWLADYAAHQDACLPSIEI